MKPWIALLLASVCSVATAASSVSSASSAATDPATAAKPDTVPRVGGSPADAEFRAVIQHSGDEYRAAKAQCRAGPSDQRSACLKDALDTLKKTRADAKTAHDEAVRAARAARKS